MNAGLFLIFFSFSFFYNLQCLEQEKHVLRRKLSVAESERDVRIQDLEADYNDLRSKLMSQVIRDIFIKFAIQLYVFTQKMQLLYIFLKS